MPTYREIADSEIDAESPITETLMTALTNNLLAVIEADATAPEISLDALDDDVFAVGSSYTSLSRSLSTNYTNSTGRAIFTSVTVSVALLGEVVNIVVDGVEVGHVTGHGTVQELQLTAIVPNGSVCRVVRDSTSGAIVAWRELRA